MKGYWKERQRQKRQRETEKETDRETERETETRPTEQPTKDRHGNQITEFKLPDIATPGAKMSPRLLSYMSPKFIFNVYLIFFYELQLNEHNTL